MTSGPLPIGRNDGRARQRSHPSAVSTTPASPRISSRRHAACGRSHPKSSAPAARLTGSVAKGVNGTPIQSPTYAAMIVVANSARAVAAIVSAPVRGGAGLTGSSSGIARIIAGARDDEDRAPVRASVNWAPTKICNSLVRCACPFSGPPERL